MTDEPNKNNEPGKSTELMPPFAFDLPLREEVKLDDQALSPKQKPIAKTLGGKIVDFFVFQVMGAGVNSAASVGLTYYANPKDGAGWVIKKLEALSGGHTSNRGISRVVEILFMAISGTLVTAAMIPVAKNRDSIAYWINKKLGKDTDVLPDNLKPVQEPRTLEDKLQQEVDKRVNKHHTAGDFWKARWLALLVPIFGVQVLAKWNTARETANPRKWSVDTKSWNFGQYLHDKVIPERWVDKLSDFYTKHGATMDKLKENNPTSYQLLENIERETNNGLKNEKRMMIADQTRMLGVEIGWTLILAQCVQWLANTFHDRRIKREQNEALGEITKEGLVPKGYRAIIEEGVKLERIEDKNTSWANKNTASKIRPEKSDSFASSVDKSRGEVISQPAL